MFVCLGITLAGPFVYCEAITHLYGKEMESELHECWDDSPLNGPMHSYKIVRYTGKHATAYVIGKENLVAGITDDPILQVDLSKHGNHWEADSCDVLYSYRLNKDGITFPPYQ